MNNDSSMHLTNSASMQVESSSLLSANVGIEWQGRDCHFSDWRFIPVINLWRDYLPAEIESQLPGAQVGDCLEHRFKPGELFPPYQNSQIRRLPKDRFQPTDSTLANQDPRLGRFYTADCFQSVPGIFKGNRSPARIIGIDNASLSVDFNHPLAGREIDFKLCIESVGKPQAERGGRCNDIPALVGDLGPGMQDSLADALTDFWSDEPLEREDERDDCQAFAPRLTPFWDKVALAQVSRFYSRSLHNGDEILDLMAGVHSPLLESSLTPARITGAGLNRIELDHNPLYAERFELNVNDPSPLPFDDASFDAVLIHAAFEYATKPRKLISEVARTLKPGGTLIISFSNRFVSAKAIKIWTRIDDFERSGLLLSVLRESGAFGDFLSTSQRDLWRPEDDELAGEYLYSDPVHVIQARKKA